MDLFSLTSNADCDHSRKVSQISRLMAHKAGYSKNEIEIISQAAWFHDVGKSDIPECILNKPSKLTPDEYEIVQTHTTNGYRQINEAARILSLAAVVAREHHEHVNGDGYFNLTGREMHPYSKLVACADVFDALRSRRVYKDPWSIDKIRDLFAEQSGKHFDTAMVSVLFSIMDDVLTLYQK